MTGVDVWAGVRERVLALSAAPHRDKVFGAHEHAFEPADVLTGHQVADIEARLGIRLPDEYRTFLLEVGASGAGPAYGLLRPDPEREPWRNGTEPPVVDQDFADRLAAHSDVEPYDGAPGAPADERERRAAYETWEREYDTLDEQLAVGTLCLNHQGCGYFTLLVLNGPRRGTLWDDLRAADEGIVPLQGARAGFAGWYLAWLRDAERYAWGDERREQPAPDRAHPTKNAS
ncbi:SMI1/KNR4 family protein [Streptomyces sp. NRRL F-525]|uniref:SMI1/KNR4 family protein n=1 Tax=Streptomyces sp. NRRL F-525 TaxID=1463861 RepID=UPI00069100F1|nr:SMI1/KNR4 family protein [Streptomyces sp. NRRL F-525]